MCFIFTLNYMKSALYSLKLKNSCQPLVTELQPWGKIKFLIDIF